MVLDRLGDGRGSELGVSRPHHLDADGQAVGHPGRDDHGRGAEQVGRMNRAHQLEGRIAPSALAMSKSVRERGLSPDRAQQHRVLLVPTRFSPPGQAVPGGVGDRPAGEVGRGQVVERVAEEPAPARPHQLVELRLHDPQVWREDRVPQLDRFLVVGRNGLGDLEAVIGERIRRPSHGRGDAGVRAAARRFGQQGDPGPGRRVQVGEVTGRLSGSRGCWPAIVVNPALTSATRRAITPSTAISWNEIGRSSGGITVAAGTEPVDGLIEATPQQCAGLRSDPPRSLPRPSGVIPVARAAASPPLEPPAMRSGSHGLRVRPCNAESVCTRSPKSGRFVRPNGIAPAARSRSTWGASIEAIASASAGTACVVGVRPGRCSP